MTSESFPTSDNKDLEIMHVWFFDKPTGGKKVFEADLKKRRKKSKRAKQKGSK